MRNLVAALLFLCAGPALADFGTDPSREIMGRLTYPAKALTIETELAYDLTRIKDENRDTASHTLGCDYGLSEDWTVQAGIESREGPRRAFVYDRLSFAIWHSALKRPFQFAPYARYAPSLRKEADEWSLGALAMKNYGRWVASFAGRGNSSKQPGSSREMKGSIHVGSQYRLGTGSAVGTTWSYETDGANALHVHMAAALSRNVFLGFEPKIGLSRRAPAVSLDLLLGVYLGPYDLLSWILE